LKPEGSKKPKPEKEMTWSIKPTPSNGMKESEVVLRFVDFPQYTVGEYSNELANHFRGKITAKFQVTYDYLKVRGYNVREIAGLSGWKSEWGYDKVEVCLQTVRHGTRMQIEQVSGGNG
jgi:hypothetical protein